MIGFNYDMNTSFEELLSDLDIIQLDKIMNRDKSQTWMRYTVKFEISREIQSR